MKSYYPIMIDIENKPCLIIGGGKVAYRKVNELLRYNAKINLISKGINEDVQKLIDEKKINYLGKAYNSALLEKACLVIAATNDKELNKKVIEDCDKMNILVNSVDSPKESSFIQPSKIRKGDITISVSTGGKSPILSKIIRDKVDELIKDSYSGYLEILGEFRLKALNEISNEEERRNFFSQITSEEYLRLFEEYGKGFVYKQINNEFCKHIVKD